MNDGTAFGRQYFETAGITPIPVRLPGVRPVADELQKAFNAVRGLRRIAKDFGADVIHVHAPTLCLAARGTGLPVSHDVQSNGRWPQ